MKMPVFPFPDRPRLFGVAVSHYQVEGDDRCDWTEWEAAGRTRGGACGRAAGSWERYEEDAALAASLGANAFRFSVSWSRVEPFRGAFDSHALGRYRRFVEKLTALGIEPVVTLLHYTHPAWFHRETPWTSTASVGAFARFARTVAAALSPHVRLWTILNEPLVLVLGGFLDGQIPPGMADTGAARRALDHLFAAHASAAAAIREEAPGSAISVAHNMMSFAPERPVHPLDRLYARAAHVSYNRGLLEAFGTGRWDLWLPPFSRISGRRDDLPASLDVLGVNFYSRLHIRAPGRSLRTADFSYRDRTGRGLTDNGWEIVPEAFGPLLAEAASLGKPLVVSETGLADETDARRAGFLRAHVGAVDNAIAKGIPVHGFFYWSLVDNYEWLDGFGPKFGLFALDPRTLARRPRPSVNVFRELSRKFLAASSPVDAQKPVHI
jgi:beta-glucosidase